MTLSRPVFLFCLSVLFTAAPPARAEEPATVSQTRVITPVQECFDKMTPEEVMDIRNNFAKPYQECQRRLQDKLRQSAAPQDNAAAAPVAQTPRNFVRVQQDPVPPAARAPSPARDAVKTQDSAKEPPRRRDGGNFNR